MDLRSLILGIGLTALVVVQGCTSSPTTQSPTPTPSASSGLGATQSGAPSAFYVVGNESLSFFLAGTSASSGAAATGQVFTPQAVAVDPNSGDVATADLGVTCCVASSVFFYYQVLGEPVNSISGTTANIVIPDAVAFDSTSRLYVAQRLQVGPPGIFIYAAGASGNVAPTATIQGNNTPFNQTATSGPYAGEFCLNGVAVDQSSNVYVSSGYVGCPNAIYVFAAGATGNVGATATITGSNTGLSGISGVAIGPAGIYVSNLAANTITIYPASANGNVAPTTTIAGSNTMLSTPVGIDVDAQGNIYVANGSNVLIFAPGASGNVAPIMTVATTAFRVAVVNGILGHVAGHKIQKGKSK